MALVEKYRPAFSAAEIQYLIDVCNLDQRAATAEIAFAIASRLKVFALKAQLGIVGNAFTSAPKQSLDEKLGLDDPAARRKAAFDLYNTNSAMCTPAQLRMARTYRYENGLMTPVEEAEYEAE